MATRATYRFIDRSDWRPITTVYNHWDGYPEGAASHLCTVRNAEDIRAMSSLRSRPGMKHTVTLSGAMTSTTAPARNRLSSGSSARCPTPTLSILSLLMKSPADFCERFGHKEEAA